MKQLNLIIMLFFFIIINGCTLGLWHDKEKISGDPYPIGEKKKYDSYLIKNKNDKFFIKFNNNAGDNLQNRYLLISNESTEFHNKLDDILNLPEYIQITSINIIIDEMDERESTAYHEGYDQRYNKMNVSVGFNLNLPKKNKPVFLNENQMSISYDLNKLSAINKMDRLSDPSNYDCIFKLVTNPIIKLIIMKQWQNDFPGNAFDSAIKSYFESFINLNFKGFLNEAGNIIDSPCSFVVDEIKNDPNGYVGALFFTKMESKDENRELNYYVKLPINIKNLIDLGTDYGSGYPFANKTYLAPNEQALNETHKDVMYPTGNFLETDKYYIRFSQDYRIDNNIVNELSTSISKLTFKDIPTTIIIAKRRGYPLVIKIIATPFAVVADVFLVLIFLLGGIKPG